MSDDKEFTFDKFIDDIVIKETRRKTVDAEKQDETPAQKYNRMYRELPQNRIVYTNGGK